MPTTPIYALPFENNGDVPAHTLRAEAGPILAEAVETALQGIVNADPFQVVGDLDVVGDLTVAGTVDLSSVMRPTFAESTTDIAAFTNTTFAAGSPVVGLTFVAPPSGKVHVTVTGLINSATNTVRAELGWELRQGGTIGTGTIVLAASVDRCLATSHAVNTGATASIGASHRYPVLTGLTPGDTYNLRTMHRVQPAAGTGNINYRSICTEPVL